MKTYCLILIAGLSCINPPWEKVEIDPDLHSLEIDSEDWTYPWYVIKHEDHFENLFGESISEKDTAHLIRNSQCIIREVSNGEVRESRLPFARGLWKNDTLTLSIFHSNAFDNQVLTLKLFKGKFTSTYVIAYMDLPMDWKVEFLEESLSMNCMPKPGKYIKGRLSILLKETIRWPGEIADQSEVLKLIEGTFVIEG